MLPCPKCFQCLPNLVHLYSTLQFKRWIILLPHPNKVCLLSRTLQVPVVFQRHFSDTTIKKKGNKGCALINQQSAYKWNFCLLELCEKVKFKTAEEMKNFILFWQTYYCMLIWMCSLLYSVTKEPLEKSPVLTVSAWFFLTLEVS